MPSSYIVRFKDDTPEEVKSQIKSDLVAAGGKISQEYSLIQGFACTLPDEYVSTLSSHPHIAGFEQDQVVTTQ